jgi:hypothetical protein
MPLSRVSSRATASRCAPLIPWDMFGLPFYVRGKPGVVERVCGIFDNPEERAYARSGLPRQPLYRMRFRQTDLWPGYGGQVTDTVDIEIYQHWLEPAS